MIFVQPSFSYINTICMMVDFLQPSTNSSGNVLLEGGSAPKSCRLCSLVNYRQVTYCELKNECEHCTTQNRLPQCLQGIKETLPWAISH
mmetsp:Transcript_8237/g.9481  ORF Transcript_8237/g.9481 Transcript_8237/m.9481 type:complete len:89 (-) Transcript_8237:125-391(-)